MLRKRRFFAVLLMALLLVAVLALAGCGQEEGREAREMVDEAGRQATDFAEGFCGAIVLVPLFLGLVVTRRQAKDESD